ncbi:MAG: hypoxanthine phosphoribosyltransferase [Bacteroidetes bacterium]|nr:hypoxanthine phosphoribosyltransferase [Bacteroidota bacterium]
MSPMPEEIRVNGEVFVQMISERRIKDRVRELAEEISKDYAGTVPVFIGVLNGSFIFFADLIRDVSVDCEVDFLKLSSYGDAKISSGDVRLLKDLNCEVEGRDIIIVEDVVDSGLSMDYIKNLIWQQNPKSFRIVTLLYKRDSVKSGILPDYVGFTIPSDFVIGYGLDYAQKERNLRSIYRLVDQPADARKAEGSKPS